MKWTHLLAIGMWIVGVLLLLKVAEASKLVVFDPQQKLLMQSMTSDFDQKFAHSLKTYAGELSNTLVHFRAGSCICETLVESHSEQLTRRLSVSGYRALTINLEHNPAIAAYIPSTPAVAVFNEAQQLVYLGPYAVGLGCFTDDSLIATITQYLNIAYLGAHINADVSGCYCAT